MQFPEQRANYRHKFKLRSRRGERNSIQRPHDKQIGNQADQPHRADVQDGVIKGLGIRQNDADHQWGDDTGHIAAHIEYAASNAKHFFWRGIAENTPSQIAKAFGEI